ncbi:3610_t:CDS:2 [Entrophospora sp. SA101]|nr:3610_t:CDS:2 [Entrophospora sp. SA101]
MSTASASTSTADTTLAETLEGISVKDPDYFTTNHDWQRASSIFLNLTNIMSCEEIPVHLLRRAGRAIGSMQKEKKTQLVNEFWESATSVQRRKLGAIAEREALLEEHTTNAVYSTYRQGRIVQEKLARRLEDTDLGLQKKVYNKSINSVTIHYVLIEDFSPVRDVPHLQRAHTPDEEEEISLYDTFPVHIYKQPVPNPFLVRNKHDHDIDEEDDEFNADLTIVGGKSIDWIISGINIREKLAKYQLDVNPPKTNPEYYDIIFFNLNDEDGFLGTLDKGIVAQMRKEIRRPEVDTNDNMNQEIKSFLKSIIDRDIKKTKENLNHRNAKKIDSFEKRVKVMEDVNLFYDPMSEGTYIINVLAPILDYFFNKNKKDWLVSYGETCLKACAQDVNSNKKDVEHRSSGKKIDTIICMREEDKEFSVTEVSGPPLKNDWAHFWGDRMKIMKMLKTLMNKFAKLKPSSDITLIKLYGLQAYLNELTIYEFQLKYTEIYTTEAILTFPLPKTWADMAKADEAIMGLLKYERLLSEGLRTI